MLNLTLPIGAPFLRRPTKHSHFMLGVARHRSFSPASQFIGHEMTTFLSDGQIAEFVVARA
jgi:hypothetical protein